MINLTAAHVDEAIARSLRSEAYLDAAVLDIPGFATPAMRRLFSNLCHLDGLNYLEVGTYCGATFIAALNNNPVYAVGIDNFSQPFGQMLDIRRLLADNLNRWKHTTRAVTFFDDDCFAVTYTSDEPFDVFYYDGLHEQKAQAKALPHFFHLLADRFLFIVDDYSWEPVAKGTEQGFKTLEGKLKVMNEWVLFEGRPDGPTWHNGVAIFLCDKIK